MKQKESKEKAVLETVISVEKMEHATFKLVMNVEQEMFGSKEAEDETIKAYVKELRTYIKLLNKRFNVEGCE